MRRLLGNIQSTLSAGVYAVVFGLVSCIGDNHDPVTVNTQRGPIEGQIINETAEFLGIPYAKPPVGERRWQKPVRPESWATTRSATAWPPKCPQLHVIKSLVKGKAVVQGREDCLYLNLWTPASRVTESSPEDPGRPVMVFIHGGGNELGSGRGFGPLEIYEGDHLSSKTNTVVVTFNYRLGALGYLAHSALAEKNDGVPGNYGLLDQIEALEWIRDNISRFGGDPDRVMVFGESAGGNAVYHLLASPSARGLFQRAAVMSGPPDALRRDEAKKAGKEIAKGLDCQRKEPADKRICLMQQPATRLVRHQSDLLDQFQGDVTTPVVPRTHAMNFAPVIGGKAVETHPFTAMRRGDVADVPTIIGTNRDEMNAWVGRLIRGPKDIKQVFQNLTARSDATQRLREMYSTERYGSPQDVYGALFGDLVFHCPAKAARHSLARTRTPHVYGYVFDDAPIRFDFIRNRIGVFHGLQLFYLFGHLGGWADVLAPRSKELAQTLMTSWGQFAAKGAPSKVGGFSWRPFLSNEDNILSIQHDPKTVTGFRKRECLLLARPELGLFHLNELSGKR